MKLLKTNMVKIVVAFMAVALIAVAGIWVYLQHISVEGRAKQIVVNYVQAIVDKQSTVPYADSSIDHFMDVFSYKFVSAGAAKKERIVTITEKQYNLISETLDGFDSFEEYFSHELRYVGELSESNSNVRMIYLDDSPQEFQYTLGDTYREVLLRYDMGLKDSKGIALYKKVYFRVDNNDANGQYKIKAIYY